MKLNLVSSFKLKVTSIWEWKKNPLPDMTLVPIETDYPLRSAGCPQIMSVTLS